MAEFNPNAHGDVDDELPFWLYNKPGYYYFIGNADGEQGVERMILASHDTIYQTTYDSGFDAGHYKRQFLIATSM